MRVKGHEWQVTTLAPSYVRQVTVDWIHSLFHFRELVALCTYGKVDRLDL